MKISITIYSYILISLQCDVCGYCTPIDPDAFPEVSEKYNVPDLAPRIRGLSFHQRSQRSATDQQTSRRIVCLEICVRYLMKSFEVDFSKMKGSMKILHKFE